MPHLANGYQVRPPGEPKGPCEDRACSLPTCMAARALAEAICEVCLEPIGYGRQILMRSAVIPTTREETCKLFVRHRSCDVSVPPSG